MSNQTLKELENVRKRWLAAKKKEDVVMMALWRRVGESLKEKLGLK